MKYNIAYQYKPEASPRPHGDGLIVPIEATDDSGMVLLPNVGDYVQIDNSWKESDDQAAFSGKVRSRIFRYLFTDEKSFCQVDIVIEDTDDNWGLVIKE